ncbi:RsbR, positive regulator of sigma-B [Halalkalibacillus sediminis]|uniref:RsbR, positive regulator of sigma-B n=1 Tax=Halalkalibacillus sediminis TaxID=2018042 RepID=A0A2I0QTK5_9BACI|nr:STAS domain-containing protein [Halalkalibacillus sediminis]PKR77671.1 RsbR, positive regulator of sigma-B [Halalkalibacillus sediminis]
MYSLGTLPSFVKEEKLLNAIGENIIFADENYDIVWLNSSAVNLLKKVISLFDVDSVEDIIGISMDHFHKEPAYQRELMDPLTTSHKARINIKDTYITDIVINPIKDNDEVKGYVVMLMDVTTKAQEEERKENLIKELSVPVMDIWEKTVAVPLVGTFSNKRIDFVILKLLNVCKEKDTDYLLLDVSGVTELIEKTGSQLEKMITALNTMGTEVIIVGISPKLAIHLKNYSFNAKFISSTKEATKYIMAVQDKENRTEKVLEENF